MKSLKKRHLSSSRVIILGFFIAIMIGSLLLMLPVAKEGKGSASFFDALFTATSATCVTGLVVQDTATYWSEFGQAVILFLIQIGGMGVVTIAVSLTVLSGKKIGLMQRSIMQDSISAPKVGGIVRLTNFIIRTSIAIELLGAILMYPVFLKQFGVLKGAWYAVFHAISSFCNAGFDLMGAKEPFSSLTSFKGMPLINIVVMLLIIVGGIGFITWEDIQVHKFHIRKYRMQSKVVLSVSAVLIIVPALYFYFVELNYPVWKGTSEPEKVFIALFQSVTTRTAGYNTIDLTKLTEVGRFLMIPLMLIGGSPGSTAGGMKTTTIIVLIASACAVFRRKPDAHLFGRRIIADIVRNAAAIFLLYIVMFLMGAMVISGVDHIPILDALFETASAIGTVGLTLGVTTKLGAVSKIVLIILMFVGRVGGLTLVFAAFSGKHANVSKLPQEKITVG